MKKVLISILMIFPLIGFSQTNNTDCGLSNDFVEPISSLTKQLKRFNATLDDLKKHVAVENDCTVNDIIVIAMSEQLGNGMYSLCIKGKKMKYKRMGSVFMKNDENPFDVNKSH